MYSNKGDIKNKPTTFSLFDDKDVDAVVNIYILL